jgi:methionyl-tRNA synthetase
VLEAVKVPKTDKLMQLKIQTGMDERTVVSGIAGFFKPEDLVGKQVCLLANLEPRVIKGITSHGMILLAEDAGGKLVLVTPTEGVTNGSEVK